MVRYRFKGINKKKLLLVLFIIYILYVFGRGYSEIREKRTQISQMEEKVEIAEKTQDELQDKLSSLYNDSYIEIKARDELGLIKEGEILIRPIFEDIEEVE